MPKKILQGVVTSAKRQKTFTVSVQSYYIHPLYRKRIKKSKKYSVHSEKQYSEGDVVRFIEHRPISRTKTWIILDD